MAKVETKSIDDILPDPNNANKHTQRGHGLVENSIRRRGVGRGILAAGKNTEKPVIMAGNLTHEKARDAGIDEVVFVHTTGNQLVVTVRDDLDPISPEAIALGLEDNESSKQSYNLDVDLVAAMSAGDNGVLSELKKQDKIFGGMLEGMNLRAGNLFLDLEDEENGTPRLKQNNNIYSLTIPCTKEERDRILATLNNVKREKSFSTSTDALVFIIDNYADS